MLRSSGGETRTTGSDRPQDARTRRNALLLSLGLTILLNSAAGVLTLAYVNGTTIVETNPYASLLMQQLGAATILIHAVEIVILYPIAYGVSLIISSGRYLFREKRAYLFTFSLLIGILPAAAFEDLLSDVLVVFFALNTLAGYDRTLAFALLVAVPFALVRVARRWTLGKSQKAL